MVDKHLLTGGTGNDTAPKTCKCIVGRSEALVHGQAYRVLGCSETIQVAVYGKLDGSMVHTYSCITEDDGHTLLDGEALTFGNYNVAVYTDCRTGFPDTGYFSCGLYGLYRLLLVRIFLAGSEGKYHCSCTMTKIAFVFMLINYLLIVLYFSLNEYLSPIIRDCPCHSLRSMTPPR